MSDVVMRVPALIVADSERVGREAPNELPTDTRWNTGMLKHRQERHNRCPARRGERDTGRGCGWAQRTERSGHPGGPDDALWQSRDGD